MLKSTSNFEQYITRTGNQSTRLSRRGFDPDALDEIPHSAKWLSAFWAATSDRLAADVFAEIEAETNRRVSEVDAARLSWKDDPNRKALVVRLKAIEAEQNDINRQLHRLQMTRGAAVMRDQATLIARRQVLIGERQRIDSQLSLRRPRSYGMAQKRRNRLAKLKVGGVMT